MTLRAAVIGVGNMGANHARVYASLPGVELVAVCDQDPNRAQGVASKYRCVAETQLRALLEHKPDVVSVCTPTVTHARVAAACLSEHVATLVEKPVAPNTTEGNLLKVWGEQCSGLLMVGHIERFNPAVVALRQMVHAGALGRIYQVSTRRLGPCLTGGAGASVLVDLAVHDLDIIEWVTGQRAVSAYAATLSNVYSTAEDLALGVLTLESGTCASVMVNRLSPVKIRTLDICGERGLARVDYIAQTLEYLPNGCATEEGQPVFEVPEIVKGEPLRLELEAFCATARDGGISPVTAHDGLRALQLAEALHQSGASGQAVKV